jgi:hypothetical protein
MKYDEFLTKGYPIASGPIEGACRHLVNAARNGQEGISQIRGPIDGCPRRRSRRGDHDVTGHGVSDAYRKVILRRLAAELKREPFEHTSYSMQHGTALFAFLDSYDRSGIDWLEQLVSTSEFARLFVVPHLPVVPYHARAHWRIYDHENHTERRRRLLKLLGTHNAVVLTGHLHKQSLLVRRTESGRFTQIALSSIVRSSNASKTKRLSGLNDYGPGLLSLEPNFHPESLERRREILAQEKPWIDRFEYADQAGFAIIRVAADSVQATFHALTTDGESRQETPVIV